MCRYSAQVASGPGPDQLQATESWAGPANKTKCTLVYITIVHPSILLQYITIVHPSILLQYITIVHPSILLQYTIIVHPVVYYSSILLGMYLAETATRPAVETAIQ